jgi:hypothetical protein
MHFEMMASLMMTASLMMYGLEQVLIGGEMRLKK